MPTTFPVGKLRPGLVLYEDIYVQGAILLPRGTEIMERHLRQLQTWGIEEISVLGEVEDFARVARLPGEEAAGAATAGVAASAPAAEARLPTGRAEGNRYVATVSLGPAPGRAEWKGDFVVEGDVSGRYEVVAEGAVEVKGDLLGGRIVSRSGDVLVKGSVRAADPVYIEGTDVTLGAVEGGEIVARRRLEAHLLCGARVRAGEEVIVLEGDGTVRGGVVTAGLRIVVGTAGTREGTPTELVIPENPDRIRYIKVRTIERMLAERRADLGRLERVIQVVRALGDKVATLSPEKREELAIQTKRYLALQEEIRRLETDLAMAKAEAESDAVTMDRCPIVCRTVYPAVRVAIGPSSIVVGSKGEKVGYHFRGGRILVYVSTR